MADQQSAQTRKDKKDKIKAQNALRKGKYAGQSAHLRFKK